MADEQIKIQPDTEEVGQTQVEKKEAATEEFILPTQDQAGEMSAEQLREIYPKLVDKYVEGKKMQTAAHYENTEVARQREALKADEERIREYETKLYNDRQEFLNKQSELTYKAFSPQATQPIAPDPTVDPDGYIKYQQKLMNDEKETNKTYRAEQDEKIANLQTEVRADRIQGWIEKNITSKPEFDMVDPLEIDSYYKRNPQARSDYPDIMRVAADIQQRKNAVVNAKVDAKWKAKVDAAKNAPIDPGAQYGAEKPQKWEGMTAEQEEAEVERMIKEDIKRGGGVEQI